MVPPNSQPGCPLSSTTWLEELLAGDVRVGLEPFAPGGPDHRQGVPERELDRVVAKHEGAAEVGLPLLEDGAEIAEHDVVRADDPVWRVLPVGLQRVGPGPHDALVPPAPDPEHVRGQVADRVAGLPLPDPRRDQPALLDLSEQLSRLGLGIQQPGDPRVLVLPQFRHTRDGSGRHGSAPSPPLASSPATGRGWGSTTPSPASESCSCLRRGPLRAGRVTAATTSLPTELP